MTGLPPALVELIEALGRLPGIGPRSAERIALYLLQASSENVATLVTSLKASVEKVKSCEVCGALTETQPCPFCADPSRDTSLLCIVENPTDVLSIARAGGYQGRFHVLGGKLSPINGVGPEDLRIGQLQERLKPGSVREVILALGTDVEGEATSHYLAQLVADSGVRVTRIAQGIPVGAGLDFTDDATLGQALERRQDFH